MQRGYEAWAKYVNENGGLLGKEVRLEILDDQSSADRVASDYEKLISQEKVDLVFGPFSTRLVVPAAQVAKDYGYLFVEPAGAAEEVFTQGFDNLFYAAPAVADDHYNLLAEEILAMPADQRPKTVAYATHGRPVRAGYGVRPQGQARGRRDQDRGRRGLPAEHHRLQRHRGARSPTSKADMVVGARSTRTRVNLIVALQQLNYQPKLAAFSTAPTNPEFAEAIGDKTEGILSPTGYTPDATYPENKEFVEYYTDLSGTRRRPRTRPTRGPPVRWSRPR